MAIDLFLKKVLDLYIVLDMVISLVFHSENDILQRSLFLFIGLLVLFKLFLGWKD